MTLSIAITIIIFFFISFVVFTVIKAFTGNSPKAVEHRVENKTWGKV